MDEVKHRQRDRMRQFKWVNFLFWSIISLINYFQDVFLLLAKNDPYPWSFALVLNFDWIIWTALAPMVIWLAIRFPLTLEQPFRSFFVQFGLATSTVLIHILAEYGANHIFIRTFFPSRDEEFFFPGYFMSSVHTRYFVYYLVMGTVQRYRLYYRVQSTELRTLQLEHRLQAAQLESLRAQLQPHFLFNAHHTLSGMILTGKNKEAVEMLARIGELLRKSLEKTKSDFIPLTQELEMVNAYIAIQKIRLRERLTFTLSVESGLNEVNVPSFFIQPLVENAVRHGIEPFLDGGEITLEIKKKGDHRISFDLQNTGAALKSHYDLGIGLSNTKTRLEQLYHNDFYFYMGTNENKKGTQIYIEFPFVAR